MDETEKYEIEAGERARMLGVEPQELLMFISNLVDLEDQLAKFDEVSANVKRLAKAVIETGHNIGGAGEL